MREDVCTVLNEREPLKRQMATALEEQLTARGLSSTRIEAIGDIAHVLIQRQPRVVVLDYVLGDVATALDIISALRAQLTPTQTQIIVWTDDPSVSVAVSAIKLGANDYVQLGLTVSLERVIQSIEHSFTLIQEPAMPSARKGKGAKGEMVANAPAYNKLLQQAAGVADRNEPVVVLLGERGSGRNSLGRYIHDTRQRAGQFIDIDYDLFQGTAAEIAGSDSHRHIVPYVSHSATVYIDHIEFDDGDLLATLSNRKERLFFLRSESISPMLVVGTSSTDTADAWRRILGASVLSIPPLSHRGDDFWPLIQLFAAEAKSTGLSPRTALSPPIARELAKLSWPGNVRQLRAIVIEVISTQFPEQKNRDEAFSAELSKTDSAVVSLILDVKQRWESETSAAPWVPSLLVAQDALDRAGGNFRVAAALLGTGITQVRHAIRATHGAQ